MIFRQIRLPVTQAIAVFSGLPAHQTGFFHQSPGLVTPNVFSFAAKQ
jgi:hypothetical protein